MTQTLRQLLAMLGALNSSDSRKKGWIGDQFSSDSRQIDTDSHPKKWPTDNKTEVYKIYCFMKYLSTTLVLVQT